MKKVCGRTIENLKFELYSNGEKDSYQKIVMTNTKTGLALERRVIAPVDYHTVLSGILFDNYLWEVNESFGSTWAAGALEEMLDEVANDGE